MVPFSKNKVEIMNLTQTLDNTQSTIDSSYADSCIAERNTDIAVVLIPPDDFNLNGDDIARKSKD
jgi:hypothetical protein